MNREYHKWHSPSLNREMELLIFGHAGARVLVFPTRSGRFFDYENWGMVDTLKSSIEQGHIQLYCVDSIDGESFYCYWRSPASRMKWHNLYERYIIDEVIPLTRVKNNNIVMIAHGCSMGAYHAMTLAFRHPQHFGKVVALSGRYDLTKPMGTFRDLLDGYYNDDVYYHMPSHFVPKMQDDVLLSQLKRMEIIIAVGKTDAFKDNNVEYSDVLVQKNIPHKFDIWDEEAHHPKYWKQMIKMYL
ncbi:MAG: alpha/beta hydrolase-fold protein [Cytophagales bacterium]|nr:alpha/beta hydrolase-fold protein [Cytophagales bacterium]